jgi:hypothetical protein
MGKLRPGMTSLLGPSWYPHILELKLTLHSYLLASDCILREIGVILVHCFERLNWVALAIVVVAWFACYSLWLLPHPSKHSIEYCELLLRWIVRSYWVHPSSEEAKNQFSRKKHLERLVFKPTQDRSAHIESQPLQGYWLDKGAWFPSSPQHGRRWVTSLWTTWYFFSSSLV